jgi:hypothetical protein
VTCNVIAPKQWSRSSPSSLALFAIMFVSVERTQLCHTNPFPSSFQETLVEDDPLEVLCSSQLFPWCGGFYFGAPIVCRASLA